VFSSLGPAVEGARVLDLFAGTGALGIEALSRGASSALFVDSAPAAARTIGENLRRTRLDARGTVRRQDVLRALRRGLGPFDLILVDPPYRVPEAVLDAVLAELAARGVAAPGAWLVLTRPAGGYMPVIPLDWQLERRLAYGDAVVLVFRIP
jgi:16S rRNA (guanine(966)-N(2))-methyltransferase RsmD